MLSLGMLAARAFSMARRKRGFEPGSPPLARAAEVISRMSLVKILPRFLSWAPLRCWMLAHLLCPAMSETRPKSARMIAGIAPAGHRPEARIDRGNNDFHRARSFAGAAACARRIECAGRA